MSKASDIIDQHIAEALTKGMRNAMEKAGGKLSCPDCNLTVPKYPGRYPRTCPECGYELESCQHKH